MEPQLPRESRSQHYYVRPVRKMAGEYGEVHTQVYHGWLVVGKYQKLMEMGEVREKDSE